MLWGGCPVPRLSLGLCLGAGDTPAVLARALTLSRIQEGTRLAVRLWHKNSSYDNPKSQTCLSPLVKIHNNRETRE